MPKRIIDSPLVIAVAVLIGLLGMTHLFMLQLNARADAAADLRFNKFATDTTNKIQGQLLRYVDILPGIKGLWNVTKTPTKRNFHEYVRSINITERFPSLVSLNFSDYIPTSGTRKYEEFVRMQDGNPKFSVFPVNTNHPYRLVIRYIEPDRGNYLGRDIGENFSRDVAMAAVSKAEPYTSGEAITQLDGRTGAGLGIRLALYKGGGTPNQRERSRLFVGSAGIFVDIATLIHEAIPGPEWGFLSLRLQSLSNPGEEATDKRRLLFSFYNPELKDVPGLSERREFTVAGRTFSLNFVVPKGYFRDPINDNINIFGYLAGAAISVSAAISIYLLLVSQKRLTTTVSYQSESLANTKDQVSKLLRERLRAEQEITQQGERERQQIGRELHDDLGQKLTGASLMLGTLRTHIHDGAEGEGIAALQKISAIVESGIHTIRTLSRGLTPFDGSPHDLAAALRELCSEVDQLLASGCHLAIAYDTELLSQNESLHLYRIVQESISNALRHGQASRIDVNVQDLDGRVSLSIRDNGIGFSVSISPSDLPTSSLGLRSIRSRAQLLGLNVFFSSNETGGTTVKVE